MLSLVSALLLYIAQIRFRSTCSNSDLLYLQISESFRSFGASDSDTSVFIAIVDDTEDKTLTRISEILGHSPVDIGGVASLADTELITKVCVGSLSKFVLSHRALTVCNMVLNVIYIE